MPKMGGCEVGGGLERMVGRFLVCGYGVGIVVLGAYDDGVIVVIVSIRGWVVSVQLYRELASNCCRLPVGS